MNKQEIVVKLESLIFKEKLNDIWLVNLDHIINNYPMSEEMLLMLFKYCKDNKKLYPNYVIKTARTWYSNSVVNFESLINFLKKEEKFKKVKENVIKKLKIKRGLSEFEEEIIKNWLDLSEDVIEEALKLTVNTLTPNIKYIDAILKNWRDTGLTNIESIKLFEASKKQKPKEQKPSQTKDIPQHKNFKQREYDEEYFKNVFEDV